MVRGTKLVDRGAVGNRQECLLCGFKTTQTTQKMATNVMRIHREFAHKEKTHTKVNMANVAVVSVAGQTRSVVNISDISKLLNL